MRYQHKGQIRYTGLFPSKEYAEKWSRKWRCVAGEMAQVISDVTPLPPSQVTPGYVKQWKVRSDRDPNMQYVVSLKPDGTYECSCPHWIYRLKKRGGECKHIEKVKAAEASDSVPSVGFEPTNYIIDEHGAKQMIF